MTNANGEAVHFALPFRRGVDGKIVTDVQDSPEHIMTQVNTVVRYPVGYRVDRPEFGITFPEFVNAPVDAATIAAQVERQVPDAAGIDFIEYADAVDQSHRHVELQVRS